MKNEDWLIIFGGGPLQVSLIKKAKAMGFKTIVLDTNENAIGRRFGDEFFEVGEDEYMTSRRIIEKYKVAGVVTTATEKPMITMAQIAEDCNLPFPSVASIEETLDKARMKEKLKKMGIVCAEGIMLKYGVDIINSLATYGLEFPVVTKPTDGSGSRGVFICEKGEDLEKAVKFSRKYSRSGNILIEEFIEGDEVSIESLTFRGKTHVVQVTDKQTSNPPYCVELCHAQPSKFEGEMMDEIVRVVKLVMDSLRLDNCASHIELKIEKEEVKVIEVGPRLAGGYITSKLTPISTGVDIERGYLEIATGRRPEITHGFKKGCAIKFLTFGSGKKVKKIGNWREVSGLPGIIDAEVSLIEEKVLEVMKNGFDRYGYVIAEGKDRVEALENATRGVEFIKENVELSDWKK